jgi:hypothetical protein
MTVLPAKKGDRMCLRAKHLGPDARDCDGLETKRIVGYSDDYFGDTQAHY